MSNGHHKYGSVSSEAKQAIAVAWWRLRRCPRAPTDTTDHRSQPSSVNDSFTSIHSKHPSGRPARGYAAPHLPLAAGKKWVKCFLEQPAPFADMIFRV